MLSPYHHHDGARFPTNNGLEASRGIIIMEGYQHPHMAIIIITRRKVVIVTSLHYQEEYQPSH